MADGLSVDMIETVQRHIYDALAQTSERSILPDEEQDRMLAQACAEACDILTTWLESREWQALCPASRAPVADAIPEWERVRPFLAPLRETLAAVAQRQKNLPAVREIGDPARYIDGIIAAAEQTARRFRRYDRQELFKDATGRVNGLRADVCALSGDLTKGTQSAERRKKATSALKKVAGLLLPLILSTMVSVSPHDVAQNIPEWGHEAVKVLVVHHVGQSAQPEVKMAPPRMGPRVR